VLLIHGRADAIFPAEGGVVGGRFLLGKEAAETFWRKANGCSGEPVVTKLENSTTRSSACPGGREVSMLLLDGVGHQLPDGAAALRLQLAEVAFTFFERNAP
jgi:poly(3-hydroxybutyrate) depolymerase